MPNISVAALDATASEPGTDTAAFQVMRTGVTNAPLTVRYALGGSAVNGADYNTLSNFLVIPTGSLSANIPITPRDDSAAEGNENVALTLFDTAGYNASPSTTASIVIADNEANVPPFALQLALSSSNLFRLTLTGPATRIYNIDVASELNSWTPWATLVNTNGTAQILESRGTNTNRLFFRARMME